MQNTEPVLEHVETHRADLVGLSDRVWAMPEILYEEYRSCGEHAAMLREKGFQIEESPAGIPTAVIGRAVSGKGGGPVIAFLGEYDALPGLSQKAGLDYPEPEEAGGHGHGCGHNLLGSAALLAACALRDWMQAEGIDGEVRYYGCPAEEGGAAKAFLVRDGAFDGVDAAITWHPAAMTKVDDGESLANTRMDFSFTGRASHAAMTPHLGRSALDAAELMSVGVNYLREHVPADSRIHYAYLDVGGPAPNVVQATAKVRYSIRSPRLADMFEIKARVENVARGAAMMTGTEVAMQVFSAVSNYRQNEPMAHALREVMEGLGGVPFDEADHDYARRIQATLSEADIAATYRAVGLPTRKNEALCGYLVPEGLQADVMIGSTDVADVSWAVPTVEARVATHAIGTPGHSWQITAQGKSPAAHKGMTYAAQVMAALGRRMMAEPALLAEAKAAHQAMLAETPYTCPMPPEVSPPLRPRPNGA